jgi:hypothetical protein
MSSSSPTTEPSRGGWKFPMLIALRTPCETSTMAQEAAGSRQAFPVREAAARRKPPHIQPRKPGGLVMEPLLTAMQHYPTPAHCATKPLKAEAGVTTIDIQYYRSHTAVAATNELMHHRTISCCVLIGTAISPSAKRYSVLALLVGSTHVLATWPAKASSEICAPALPKHANPMLHR